MRAKGEALQRSAELWERGAEGEQATADVLASLPRHAWTVFHDVRWPGRQYANVDHVVVGPTGVFVIDSKNWSGSITVRENVLRQNGRSREAAVFGAAEAAIAVSQVVPVVIPQHVYPVLCFVRPDPLTGWARDVIVTSTSNLLEMLTSRPVVLPPHIAQEACLQLDAMFRSATRPPASSQPPPRRPQLPPTNPRQRQGASPGSRARR
ncbi:nuclease-related domain-containing protein, partial [Nocardioides sp.]|uniref:nuclease-related domain-containing protein n=1 Tax=Nocardioides sp. TaxID=35761 RepID=UPI0035631729